MNFLDCTLERTNTGVSVVHSGFRLALTDNQAGLLEAGGADGEVRIGIRPDNLAIEPGADGALDVPGEIFVTEPLGGDMIVEVTVGSDRVMVKTKIGPMGGPGDPCRIAFDVDRVHVFDKTTGVAYF